MERSNPKNWVVILTPHRSLTRRGFLIIMSLIATLNFAAGIVFYSIGAWPVIGFCGFDVMLIWWAFHANFADARRGERIEITETELILEAHAKGRVFPQQRFNRRWVQVELQVDEERELVGSLFLRSHGLRTEIGHFLAPGERKQLALALRAALA
jgi:uncharacterized membrane protein